jgi:hypothetical protein
MAISAVLLTEREGQQCPVYFISRAMRDFETRYPAMEKLALALVYAAWRLRRYFQPHAIKVLTEQPIQQILRKPEVSGRLAKWAIELGEHTIKYCPRTLVKGQVLADFLAELLEGGRWKQTRMTRKERSLRTESGKCLLTGLPENKDAEPDCC